MYLDLPIDETTGFFDEYIGFFASTQATLQINGQQGNLFHGTFIMTGASNDRSVDADILTAITGTVVGKKVRVIHDESIVEGKLLDDNTLRIEARGFGNSPTGLFEPTFWSPWTAIGVLTRQ